MNQTLTNDNIIPSIYLIRGQKIMLDYDLASLYSIEVKMLKRAVRRNPERFPLDFMFELTEEEWTSIRCQIGTLKKGQGQHTKYLPFAFTEQGVAMLSSVLQSPRAIEVNIAIMRTFIHLREYMQKQNNFTEQLQEFKEAVMAKFSEHEEKIEDLFEAFHNFGEALNEPRTLIGFHKREI